MLPNLRMVPVGGVLLAIVILVLNLALTRPGAPRESVAPVDRPASGVLMARADHPEWRQFLILAAIRRGDEVERLRELPDSPPPPPRAQDDDGLQVAALTDIRQTEDADDVTNSITAYPRMALPVDIGEASSTELPISDTPEQPPVMLTPQREKPAHQGQRKTVHRAQTKPPAKPADPGLFSALFGNKSEQAHAAPVR
jgi:hypothetical protein